MTKVNLCPVLPRSVLIYAYYLSIIINIHPPFWFLKSQVWMITHMVNLPMTFPLLNLMDIFQSSLNLLVAFDKVYHSFLLKSLFTWLLGHYISYFSPVLWVIYFCLLWWDSHPLPLVDLVTLEYLMAQSLVLFFI